MADAPERIWTASTEGKCHVGFATPSMNYTNEYIRADLMAELVEALTNLPAIYAHQINTGVREVYDPLQRFYTMESVLAALAKIKEPQHG